MILLRNGDRHIVCISCLILMMAFFAGCALCPEEPGLERINIAFQQWVGYGPLYLARDKGFFKEEGVELIIIDEQLDSARRDAFKQGMLDCEAGTIDLLISKRAQGVPVVAVMKLDHSFGGDGIVATEDIRTVEDLIGRKVAFARDDVGETFISYLFQQRGLSLKDITIIPGKPESAWQAFLNGEADAAVTWEPWLSKATQRSGGHILISTRDAPDVIVDTLNVREDLVKNNPGLVKKLMRGWFKAVAYYKKHPVEASRIIAGQYGITPEEYREQVKGLEWIDYEDQISEAVLEKCMNVFNTIAGIKFADGRISGIPEADEAMNCELLGELYENKD